MNKGGSFVYLKIIVGGEFTFWFLGIKTIGKLFGFLNVAFGNRGLWLRYVVMRLILQ